MITAADAKNAGFAMPQGNDYIKYGDDVISKNAFEAYKHGWRRWRISNGTDLNTIIDQGSYEVTTYTVALSLVNRPSSPSAIHAAKIFVHDNSNGGIIQEWITTPNAATASVRLQRHRDTTGAWSEWEIPKETPLAIAASTDLDTVIKPGVYTIETYRVANSLKNAPSNQPASINRAILSVRASSFGVTQLWETIALITADKSPVMYRYRDELNRWAPWREHGASITSAPSTVLSEHFNVRGIVRKLVDLSGTPIPVWSMLAPAAESPLTVPTHDGSGSVTHPSIYYAPDGFKGFKYWMAFTPYPGGNDAHEDPNIVVSNDGVTWSVPGGLVNPLDDQPGKTIYNSDTHLTLGPGGALVLTWRTVDNTDSGRNTYYQRTSTDGVTWTPKRVIMSPSPGARHSSIVSPALYWDGSKWTMWAISSLPSPNELVRWTTTDTQPTPESWGEPTVCNLGVIPADRDPWHVDIQKVGSGFMGLLNDVRRGTAGVDGDLYFMRSADGVKWELSPVPIVPKSSQLHDSIYKSSFVALGSGESLSLELFYAAFTRSNRDHKLFRSVARFVGGTGAPAPALPDTGWLDIGRFLSDQFPAAPLPLSSMKFLVRRVGQVVAFNVQGQDGATIQEWTKNSYTFPPGFELSSIPNAAGSIPGIGTAQGLRWDKSGQLVRFSYIQGNLVCGESHFMVSSPFPALTNLPGTPVPGA